MSYFLLIHTTLGQAFVAIAAGRQIRVVRENDQPREHGAFLHEAIGQMMQEQSLNYRELSAIGVTSGPGSYTGIRVGLSAAKGFGYALDIPLITCSTLQALAATAIEQVADPDPQYLPLIQARQSEYYSGLYDAKAKALRHDSLTLIDKEHPLIFTGARTILFGVGIDNNPEINGKAIRAGINKISPDAFAQLVEHLYQSGVVVSAGDASPQYLKDAFVTERKRVK